MNLFSVRLDINITTCVIELTSTKEESCVWWVYLPQFPFLPFLWEESRKSICIYMHRALVTGCDSKIGSFPRRRVAVQWLREHGVSSAFKYAPSLNDTCAACERANPARVTMEWVGACAYNPPSMCCIPDAWAKKRVSHYQKPTITRYWSKNSLHSTLVLKHRRH